MTKQGKIREGMKNLYIEQPVGESDWTHSGLSYKAIDAVFSYLHSQGVVIKVDRELPKNPFEDDLDGDWESKQEEAYYTGKSNGCETGKSIMLKAGYVAVESLIKEVE